MQIAIFYNEKTNPNNIKNAEEISKILKRIHISHFINPQKKDFKKIDLAFSAGGDGTVLYVSRILSEYKIPILGINFGHRGFLCQIDKKELNKKINDIIKGKYEIEEKTRIKATIKDKNNNKRFFEALNEITLGGINRTVYLKMNLIDGKNNIKCRIAGDGIIVSTKTGSTAYNINAGGPILLTEGFSIVANNAFFQSDKLLPTTRSIITSTKVKIKIEEISLKKDNLPYIIADGQKNKKIHQEDEITIEESDNKNYFIIL